MMEIVDIVNHLRLNIHNILETRPASIFMRNGGSGESSILSLLGRASLNPWKRDIVLPHTTWRWRWIQPLICHKLLAFDT